MRTVVKIYLTIHVDPEEYPTPADGDIASDIEDAMNEFIHDIDGMKIKTLNVIQETD
tara:strand:+ start:604 stop:774 length:171 start_codon:yes stop_codon:yes gene_type:complete